MFAPVVFYAVLLCNYTDKKKRMSLWRQSVCGEMKMSRSGSGLQPLKATVPFTLHKPAGAAVTNITSGEVYNTHQWLSHMIWATKCPWRLTGNDWVWKHIFIRFFFKCALNDLNLYINCFITLIWALNCLGFLVWFLIISGQRWNLSVSSFHLPNGLC